MRTKILILGLICLFALGSCKKGVENPYSPLPVNEIEEIVVPHVTFTLTLTHYGKFPAELEDIAWYQIFEIYINDGVSTYGEGLLIHTHEFGRGGGYYYELPERDWSFIPPLDFWATRTPHNDAVPDRSTKFDYEVWFHLKESNIPPEILPMMSSSFRLTLVPIDTNVEFNFECDPSSLSTYKECFGWEVGEDCYRSHALTFRMMMK